MVKVLSCCQRSDNKLVNLSDLIEEHIKKLLAISPRGCIDIQRHELACKFQCVPSQINYVLDSRFILERGYLVESRRGGRGYIRICRIDPQQVRAWEEILEIIEAGGFSPARAVQILKRGCEERVMTRREAQVIEVILQDRYYANLALGPGEVREVQKKLFKAALKAILKGSH